MLADAYPGQARPLGAARVLCEIGSGTSLRELRTRLGLDPGYLSRIVRTLEDEGLVRLSAHPEDGRLRVARLTAAGETELEEQHRRANVAAESLLDALDDEQRAELVTAIAEAGPSAEKYAAKRALWREKFAPHDDGHAGERVVRRLYEQGWLS